MKSEQKQPRRPPASQHPATKMRPLLEGRYDVGGYVGTSGAGFDVSLAIDSETGKPVVIKTVSEEFQDSASALSMIMIEIESLRRIGSPNVVSMIDFSCGSRRPFMVLEYIEGRTIRNERERPQRSLPELVDIFFQLASALCDIHAAGIVHRDIKPENILITQKDGGLEAKVIDFGSALIKGVSDPYEDLLVGTNGFFPPELIFSTMGLDERADIYSLGATVFELFSKSPLFSFAPDYDLPRMLSEYLDWHRSFRQWEDRVPESLSRIVERSLTLYPPWRYQSATELRSDIESCRLELSQMKNMTAT